MGIGISFVPGHSDPNQYGGGQPSNGTGAPPTPVQQAIRLLSLRLPHVLGANALAPGALLNGAGSAGLPAGSTPMQATLQHLFGLGGASWTKLPYAIPGYAAPGSASGGTPQPPPTAPTPHLGFQQPPADNGIGFVDRTRYGGGGQPSIDVGSRNPWSVRPMPPIDMGSPGGWKAY